MRLFRDYFWKTKYSIFIFVIKVIAGFSLSWIYTHQYPNRSEADIFRYFDDARLLNDVFYKDRIHFTQMMIGIEDNSDPFIQDYMKYSDGWRKQTQSYLEDRKIIDFNIFNDHHTITRINALLLFISFGVYEVHILFFCFIALIGLRLINQVADHFLFEFSLFRHFLIYLFPSVLIWTSGANKESLLVFGIGLLLSSIQKFSRKYDVKFILLSLLAGLIIIKSKYFVLLILLPIIPLLFQFKKTNRLVPVFMLSLVSIVVLLGLNSKLFTKQHENLVIVDSYPKTTIVSPPSEFNKDALNNLESFGQAIFNTYVQPLFLKSDSTMVSITKIENVIFLILFILALSKIKSMRKEVLVLCIGTILISSILIGLSTIIVGNIHRYKLSALIVLLICCGQYFPYQFKINLETK